ncbi:restriction endonuclease subunit S, partial [Roseibium sp.]
MSWPTYALDELGTVSRGRSRHRPRDAEHLYGGAFPFIQTGDVKAAPMYLKSFSQTYSEAGLAQSKMWPKGTLCITIAANIAETCILDIEACFPDSIIGFVADSEKADTKFIKYQFDAIMREQMRRVSQGAAQDNLSQAKLLSFHFPVPDLPTQKRIAGVLSAYDDLIENNRRRLALLEQAARILYREWFVHFRFPGFETAKFVDGLPEGWTHELLSDLCTEGDGIQTGPFGSQLHQSDYTDEGVPVVMPKNMKSGKVDCDGIARIPEALADKLGRHRMLPGDTVFGRRGEIGRKAFIGENQRGFFCGTGCLRMRPIPGKIDPRYLFETLGSPATAGFIVNQAKGSTMPNLSAGALKNVPILCPPNDIQVEYVEKSAPIFEQIEILDRK